MEEMERETLTESCLRWLDGLCACYLGIRENQCPEAFQGRGVVVPEGQVALALSGQCPTEPQPGFLAEFQALTCELARSEEPLARLIRRLELEGMELLALLLALAPRLNRKYERVFAYLQDDAAQRQATLGLCADLWALTAQGEESAVFQLNDPARPLNRWGLKEGEGGLSRELVPSDSALAWVQELDYLPHSLSQVGTLLPPDPCPETLAHEELFAQARQFAVCCTEGDTRDRPGLLRVFGGEGSGKGFLTRHIARATGRPVLELDCEKWSLLPEQRRRDSLREAAAWVCLRQAIPALTRFDLPDSSAPDRRQLWQELLEAFRPAAALTLICARRPDRLPGESVFRSLHLTLPAATIRQQERCWDEFSRQGVLPLGEELSPRHLASIYALAPGQIRQVLTLAEADALSRSREDIDREAIGRGVRRLCSLGLRELTEPLTNSFTWEDLEVDQRARQQLEELCDRIRCRWQVNEEWGFDKRLPYGKGVSVCLYGPPGTGKTMTAQVLAREFGLDAYRVDLSRIMDKYIGETEKKLGELFDAAKDSNSILFFDEADALFAKRTEVGDSKDRYANVETAYLLQRMERHNGICILATNAANNLDEAFKRRISYMISLPMPDEATRARLWHKVFPPEAPLERVDLEQLAQRFELTGSSIKNAALTAAYLAAAQGKNIGRSEILRGIQDEYRKTGRILMEHELY